MGVTIFGFFPFIPKLMELPDVARRAMRVDPSQANYGVAMTREGRYGNHAHREFPNWRGTQRKVS